MAQENDQNTAATLQKAAQLQTLGMIKTHADAAMRAIFLRDEHVRRAQGASPLVLAGDGPAPSDQQAMIRKATELNGIAGAEMGALLEQAGLLRQLVGEPARQRLAGPDRANL